MPNALSQRPRVPSETTSHCGALFNRVTSDFLYFGELDDEECHWTNQNVNGLLLIQRIHSGYIQVLPCNIASMTVKAAAKLCVRRGVGGWDVPSEVITDSGREYTSKWWNESCTRPPNPSPQL